MTKQYRSPYRANQTKQCQWCRRWYTPAGLKRHAAKLRWGHPVPGDKRWDGVS